jgi:hypothetical protein
MITVSVIPHNQQRYDTCGDWWWDCSGDLVVLVSSLNNWKYEALVAVHEIVEAYACRRAGVSENAITKFDTAFEENRSAGNTDEPGDHPKAPYRLQHCLATGVERVFAVALGVNWKKYENKLNSL